MQSVQHLSNQNTNVSFILYHNIFCQFYLEFYFSKIEMSTLFYIFSFMCKMVTVVHYSHLLVGFCPGVFFFSSGFFSKWSYVLDSSFIPPFL